MTLTAEQIDRIGIKVIRRIQKGNRESALRILRDNELLDEAEWLERPTEQFVVHDFKCPAHGVRVATNCRQNTCKFWVQSDMANNCLLAYTHQQQTDHLNGDEIAYLYGQPVEQVRSDLDAAMTSLRVSSIQSDAANDPDIERTFWFVETTTVCCVCGSLTDQTIKLQDTPLAYCSRECQEEKPADVMTCEYRFGRSIETILRWAVRRFRNLPVLEKTIGLKRETLIELTRQHLGRDLAGFFPKVKLQSETQPWRRRSGWSAEAAAAKTVQLTSRHGKPVFGLDALRGLLWEVLT